jgi:protein disulfide-isomerase A6
MHLAIPISAPDAYPPPRFYAPWCGHCQNLKQAYEKAAKNLAGLAKVAAVNCDEDSNKPFCGQMGVQGFPTLKIVKPGLKPGKPVVEDYQGPRNAEGIVDAVVDKIPNHVKRLQDKDLESWLSTDNATAKAILFTEKGTTSALLRAVAIEFLGSITVAQIRDKENAAVEMFGISEYPKLVLLPGGAKESLVYDGEMKKQPMVAFLSHVSPPNPDPAPKSARASSTKKSKAAKSSSSASSAFSEASASHKSAEASEAAGSASPMTLEESDATGSPMPIVPPAETPISVPQAAPPIATLITPGQVYSTCLGSKTGTCVLALLPSNGDPDALPSPHVAQALSSLADIAEKHVKRKAKFFPFYAIPADNQAAKNLRNELGLKPELELEIIAVNGKRSWWRRFSGVDTGVVSIEDFIDNIKLGEGTKEKLPEGVTGQEPEVEKEKEKETKHEEL